MGFIEKFYVPIYITVVFIFSPVILVSIVGLEIKDAIEYCVNKKDVNLELEYYSIRKGRATKVYQLHKKYKNCREDWECTFHWEENMYDIIKNMDKVIYDDIDDPNNIIDAKQFFKVLKTKHTRSDKKAEIEHYKVLREQIDLASICID
jgi:hypothetical protein